MTQRGQEAKDDTWKQIIYVPSSRTNTCDRLCCLPFLPPLPPSPFLSLFLYLLSLHDTMGKVKRTKRFALMKRVINAKEKKKEQSKEGLGKKKGPKTQGSKHKDEVAKTLMAKVHRHEQASSALYFRYNTQLGPPYHILLGEKGDTKKEGEGAGEEGARGNGSRSQWEAEEGGVVESGKQVARKAWRRNYR